MGKTYAIEARDVFGWIEGNRFFVVDIEELLQVEDLNVVVERFATNDDEVLKDSDLSPYGSRSTLSLRQAAEISELTAFDNLNVQKRVLANRQLLAAL